MQWEKGRPQSDVKIPTAVAAAHKKAFAKKLGVTPTDLGKDRDRSETILMNAARLHKAGKVLKQSRPITDEDVLSVLSSWSVKKNVDRRNVMPEGSPYVLSETFGLVRKRGSSGPELSGSCRACLGVLELWDQYFRERLPAYCRALSAGVGFASQ